MQNSDHKEATELKICMIFKSQFLSCFKFETVAKMDIMKI